MGSEVNGSYIPTISAAQEGHEDELPAARVGQHVPQHWIGRCKKVRDGGLFRALCRRGDQCKLATSQHLYKIHETKFQNVWKGGVLPHRDNTVYANLNKSTKKVFLTKPRHNKIIQREIASVIRELPTQSPAYADVNAPWCKKKSLPPTHLESLLQMPAKSLDRFSIIYYPKIRVI